MWNTSVVQVSGRGNNVDFTIDDTSPFDQVVYGLRRYLVDNRHLWSKGTIAVNAGLRMGSSEQLNELKAVIEKESGLRVTRFWCSPDAFIQALDEGPDTEPQGSRLAHKTGSSPQSPTHNEYSIESPATTAEKAPTWITTPEISISRTNERDSASLNVPTLEPRNLDSNESPRLLHGGGNDMALSVILEPPASLITRNGPDQNPLDLVDYTENRRDTALFVKSTCRSGESIRYRGDVVVLGDVNPGAEIEAAGDITVFGALRGAAHAGSGGWTKAAIIALRLESPRLQIGPYAGLSANTTEASENRPKSTGPGPMIAYVRRRSIYVADFVGRFARYSKGILYDG